MSEDNHIAQPFQLCEYLMPYEAVSNAQEQIYVKNEDAYELDQHSDGPLSMGLDYKEDRDQLSPSWFDGLSMDDASVYATFAEEPNLEHLYGVQSGMLYMTGEENDGDPQDLQSDWKAEIESIQTYSLLSNYHRGPGYDSAVSLPNLVDTKPSLPSRIHRCKVCQRCFDNEYLLEDHARLSNHQIYVCDVPGCFKSYCRRDVLRRHVATHTRLEISCPFCSNHKRLFKRKDNLSQHVRTRHPELYKRYKSMFFGSVHQKQLLAVPATNDAVSYAGSDANSEYGGWSPQRTPPRQSQSGSSTIEWLRGSTTEEIASALGTILGDENHIVVQVIQRRLDLGDRATMEQLATGLAHLALVEPNGLTEAVRSRLQQTSARSAL